MAPPTVNKVDVNAIDKSGETALIRESRLGDTVFVRSLIEKGADVNIADLDGFTPLIYASRYGYIHVVKLLIDNGANLNTCDNNRYNSLMWASREGHIDVVQLLIQSGANVDMIGKDGKTVLLTEIMSNRIDFAKTLIENGANVNAPDSNGLTPLMAAAAKNNLEMVKLLHDANVNVPDSNGTTPLMVAVAKNNLDMVKLLLDRGADVTATDKEGLTVIIRASQAGHIAIAKRLSSHWKKVMTNKEKECDERVHRIETTMEVIQGRNQIFKLLLDADIATAFLTKGYLNDCTNNWVSETTLSKGAFGAAYYGEDKENAKLKYVVKRASVTSHTEGAWELLKQSMQSNISALMRCRHTNIARMYGYWFDQCASGPTDVFFLYEYPLNGHLLDILIHDEKRQNLTAKRRVKILYEVSRALLFLHKGLMDGTTKYTFCHRDVKSSSIYLTADYTAKLMDCGLSVIAGDASSSVEASGMKLSFATMDDFNVIGTPGYVCPSYASGKMQCYDSSCDLYSFGIVIMEVLTGWPQFGQSNLRSCSQNLIRKYHEKTLLLNGLDEMAGDEWNHVASDLCDCAFSCVQIDHRERPSTEEIFELLSDVYTRLVLSPNTSPTKQ